MLANGGIDKLKTTRVDLKVDGIIKSKDVLVIGSVATYILLGRDHPSVKAWITHQPITEVDEVHGRENR